MGYYFRSIFELNLLKTKAVHIYLLRLSSVDTCIYY